MNASESQEIQQLISTPARFYEVLLDILSKLNIHSVISVLPQDLTQLFPIPGREPSSIWLRWSFGTRRYDATCVWRERYLPQAASSSDLRRQKSEDLITAIVTKIVHLTADFVWQSVSNRSVSPGQSGGIKSMKVFMQQFCRFCHTFNLSVSTSIPLSNVPPPFAVTCCFHWKVSGAGYSQVLQRDVSMRVPENLLDNELLQRLWVRHALLDFIEAVVPSLVLLAAKSKQADRNPWQFLAATLRHVGRFSSRPAEPEEPLWVTAGRTPQLSKRVRRIHREGERTISDEE